MVPADVLEVGDKVAVKPLAVGDTVAVKLTVPVNPPLKASVTVLVTVAPPRVAVSEVGEAVRPKSLTVNVTAAVCTSEPLMPVTVMVKVPPAVVLAELNVRVDVPAPVIDVGEKVAVTPGGAPLVVNATEPPNPPRAVVVMVLVPAAPLVTVTVAGDAVKPKSDATTSVAATDLTKLPLVAVMVKL